ncbi:MAG TPA: glutaredoxin family protein [Burkholderiaceae bacterium]|nr:glutaredoxin family protein [Burkholderiaceae bacterium]
MRTPSLALAAALIAATTPLPATAQYKWVDAGGRTTYSDMPPPPGVAATALAPGARPAPRDDVPPALAAAASRHPVTLYTTESCVPCQQARAHLDRRGIPYAERTVRTVADAELFKRAGFAELSFPALGVGRDRSVGFEAGEWDRSLDAAGYPKTSVLPPSYRRPPARALAASTPPPKTGSLDDEPPTAAGEAAEAVAARPPGSRQGPAADLAVRAGPGGRSVVPTLRF